MRLRLGRFYEDQRGEPWVVIAQSAAGVYKIVRTDAVELDPRWVDPDGQQDGMWSEAARHDTCLVRRVIPDDVEPNAVDDLAELV